MAYFQGRFEGVGAGGELTLDQELWILLNSGKNIIESSTSGSQRQVTNIVEDTGSIRVTHDD